MDERTISYERVDSQFLTIKPSAPGIKNLKLETILKQPLPSWQPWL